MKWLNLVHQHLKHNSTKKRRLIRCKNKFFTWFSIEQLDFDNDSGSIVCGCSIKIKFFKWPQKNCHLLDVRNGIACKLNGGTWTRTINSCNWVRFVSIGILRRIGDKGMVYKHKWYSIWYKRLKWFYSNFLSINWEFLYIINIETNWLFFCNRNT